MFKALLLFFIPLFYTNFLYSNEESCFLGSTNLEEHIDSMSQILKLGTLTCTIETPRGTTQDPMSAEKLKKFIIDKSGLPDERFENFSMCFKEGDIYYECYNGLNGNRKIQQNSISKLYFADMAYELKNDNESALENIIPDFEMRKIGGYCYIEGTGAPSVTRDQIKKTCPGEICIDPKKITTIGGLGLTDEDVSTGKNSAGNPCKDLYDQLSLNISFGPTLYANCLKEKQILKTCPHDILKKVSSTPKQGIKLGSIMNGMLRHSDSYSAFKAGATTFDGLSLRQHFKRRYGQDAEVYSKVMASCKTTVNLPVLQECNKTKIPNVSDEHNTWDDYAKSSANKTLCGKTGSNCMTYEINFAGCEKVNGKSLSFAIYFDQEGGVFKQTQMSDRPKLYNTLFQVFSNIKSADPKGLSGTQQFFNQIGSLNPASKVTTNPNPVGTDRKPASPASNKCKIGNSIIMNRAAGTSSINPACKETFPSGSIFFGKDKIYTVGSEITVALCDCFAKNGWLK